MKLSRIFLSFDLNIIVFLGELYYGNYRDGSTSVDGNIITRGGLGGQGGGALKIVSRHFIVDGHLTADGEGGPPLSTAGGGSGGSVWVECQDLSGYGSLSVDGGAGSPTLGGGGSGGRLAIYHTTMINFNGTLSAKGGKSSIEPGAAGTIYLERRNGSHVHHRELRVNNGQLTYPWAIDRSKGRLRHLLNGVYSNTSHVGAVTWLLQSTEYKLDELSLYGNAHLAIYGEGSKQSVVLQVQLIKGDRSGVLHIGRYQYVYINNVDLYFPINTLVYALGRLALPTRLSLREVYMEVNGSLAESHDYVIDRRGQLFLWSEGNSVGEEQGVFQFINISVRSGGLLYTTTLPRQNQVTINLTRLSVNAGGRVSGNSLGIVAVNITIDVEGKVLVLS